MKGSNDKQTTSSIYPIYTIPGKPVPLARPRFTKYKVYDSQSHIKDEVAWYLRMQRDKTIHRIPLDGPLQLDITFYMPIPKSTTKRLKETLPGTPHTKKPDLDNLLKFILDVSQGIILDDDKLVTTINARKLYDPIPKTVFTLRPIDERR